MAVSQATKDLIADGIWASSDSAQRETFDELGIDRAIGYDAAYEQVGTGKFPERTGFNQMFHELTASFLDMFAYGIPAWDTDVDYLITTTTVPFVVTATGLWLALVNSGPDLGNATNPETAGQTVWRRY